ncbi:MAG: hypothetical protein A2014_05145 [Spirochaetes bacterium GWF1_49_6]|nr:MAG: hypothetical protein A2014_05145 [Spirochaetes bacterium GWF1_49_6]
MTFKTFTSAFAKYVNLDELVYDITLLVLALFLRGLIVPHGKTVLDVLNPVTGTILLLAVFFSVSYYIGFIQSRYTEVLTERPKTLDRVAGISMVTLFVMIITVTIIFVREFPDADPVFSMALVFGGFCMVASGLVWSSAKKEKDGCSTSISVFILSLIIIHFFISFFQCEDNPPSILRALGIFAAGGTVLVLLFILNVHVSEKLFNEKNRAGNLIIFILFNIFIPLMTAMMVGFWQEIAAAGMIGVLHNPDEVSIILSGVLFLTVISVRVQMALAPPYRVINTGIGLAFFTVYVIILVNNISAAIGKSP